MASLSASSVTAQALAGLPVFASLTEVARGQLLQAGSVHQLEPRQRLSQLARPPGGERYCFVLAGQMVVVLDRVGASNASSVPAASQPDQVPELVGSFAAGEFFSDGYLDCAPTGEEDAVDCMAATAVTLLAAPTQTLAGLMQQHPVWSAHMAGAMAAARRSFLRQQEPTRRFVQDFFLRQGYGTARRIRVAETRHCFDCNKCEEACAARHGQSRMQRTHAHLGRLDFHGFCLNCIDQPCLDACAFDAMSIGPTGEVRIDGSCDGCGSCARKCPYQAIRVVEAPYTAADFPAPVPVSEDGATAVPGLWGAGAVLGPRGLKTALAEAKRTADRLRPQRLPPGDRPVLDAIVIGAGAAGLAAAKRCHERKLDFLALEQSPALSAKASRAATTMRILPGMEVLQVGVAGQGLLRVDVAQGSYLAQHVVVCTGQPKPGVPSLLERAGVPVIEPGSKDMATHAAGRGVHKVGIKCDGCEGYPDRACIRACPTGSLIELPPQELFFEAGVSAGERNFSAVAFVEGVAEHRARQRRHRTALNVLGALLVLALVGIGLECFLRAVLPEHSVLGMVRAWLGDDDLVWYSSGKGYGHWLGYVGTGFMLSTLFYPLRTRLGLLGRWGAQSSWLTFHLWVGFIGATLVTYHAAFKLDRWVALACYSMWIVVLSGAIGRYLYGMIHSGIGLVEFEREALDRSAASAAARRSLGPRVARLLATTVEKPGPLVLELFVMLWHELRDLAVLTWLRLAGLSHVMDRRARRQTVQYLADLAAHRRARRYLESAKRLLRTWNWIHITLTIVMFVLAGFHVTYGFMYKAI